MVYTAGGKNEEALKLWLSTLQVLELDNKARRDLFLLAQSGRVGRSHANKILWDLLSKHCLEKEYQDLSHLVTSQVMQARHQFDRPPRQHNDLAWWTWDCYLKVNSVDEVFGPAEVPKGRKLKIKPGPGDKPLPPPQCWSV